MPWREPFTLYTVTATCIRPLSVLSARDLYRLRRIVSHTFDFKDVIEGVDYSLNHKDEVIKAVIRM